MIRHLLWRYLAKEVCAAIALVLTAFLGLFAFFDFVNELDNIGRNGYQAHHALVYVLLILPGRVYELMPIAVLIGTLYALTSLARHAEITVMRAAGLSTASFLRWLAAIGSVFVVLTFLFGEYLAPPAERAAQQWKLMATGSNISSELRSGLWMRDGRRFINVRSVLPDRSLEGVRIYEFGPDFALTALSDARRGEFEPGVGWHLTDVTQTRFLDQRTELVRLPELVWPSEITPEVLSVLMVAPERMSVSTLYPYIRHLRDNNQVADRYEIALWKKMAYPFAVLVMMVLALPFGYTHDRMGGVSVKVFLGVMLGTAFYLLNGLFSNLGVINAWPAPLAALAPSVLFLSAGVFMLWWVERR